MTRKDINPAKSESVKAVTLRISFVNRSIGRVVIRSVQRPKRKRNKTGKEMTHCHLIPTFDYSLEDPSFASHCSLNHPLSIPCSINNIHRKSPTILKLRPRWVLNRSRVKGFLGSWWSEGYCELVALSKRL